jgi:hypothetical protein
MHRPRSTSILIVASALLAAPPATASWPPGGVLVSSPGDISGVRNARILDMPSGDLCVLGIGSAGNNNTFVIQRVGRDGAIAAGWPASGAAFSPVLKGSPFRVQSVVVDDASRTWHSWPTANTSLQSLAADAGASPLPSGTAFSFGSTGGSAVHAAPAIGGDVFVSTSSRLKRITVAGAPAAGWTATGVALPGSAFDDNAVMPDGSGGALVFLRTGTAGGVPVVTRFDGGGGVSPGWPATGVALSSVSPGATIAIDSQLLPSGPDHALAMWSLDVGVGTSTRQVMLQRFGLDGTLDPAWGPDGVTAIAADSLFAMRALADGTGGAYIVRQSNGHPVATHITSSGTALATDVEFVDAGAHYVPTLVGGTGGPPGIPDDMIADVTPDGGLLVGWNDTRLAPAVSFRLRWLTPALTPAAGKPDTGLVVFPASPHPYEGSMLAVHADGADGAFIAWGDYHDIGFGQISGDLWMTHVQAPAVVGVTPPPAPRALALSAPRPNPARGSVALDVTLPDDAPARVELLDVAGRVVRSQDVQGAGLHVLSFDELTSLAPGLYFARGMSRSGSAATRIMVSR